MDDWMLNIREGEFYSCIQNNKPDFGEKLSKFGGVTQFWTNLWHVNAKNVMTEIQKGGRKNTQCCKDQIIIAIVAQIFEKQRNMDKAYVDCKKAYDSVPYS